MGDKEKKTLLGLIYQDIFLRTVSLFVVGLLVAGNFGCQKPDPNRARYEQKLKEAGAILYLGDDPEKALSMVEALIESVPKKNKSYIMGQAKKLEGDCYWELSKRRDKKGYIKKTISAYRSALSYFPDKGKYNLDLAAILSDLGMAYRTLAQVEKKEEYLDQSTWAYDEALKICTQEKYPLCFAKNQIDLGRLYEICAEAGGGWSYLEWANQAYIRALRIYTQEKYPQEYAKTMVKLGINYVKNSRGEEVEKTLERAILEDRKYNNLPPPENLDIEENLKNKGIDLEIYKAQQIKGGLNIAISDFEEALKIYTPEAYPLNHAETQVYLGMSYQALAEVGDREENLKKAIEAYKEALKIYTPEVDPREYRIVSDFVKIVEGKMRNK